MLGATFPRATLACPHCGRDVDLSDIGLSSAPDGTDDLMTPAEVARLFAVDPKTVTRWAKSGKLTAQRTLGGHRRFVASEVQALLAERVGHTGR